MSRNLVLPEKLRDELVSQLEFLSHFVCTGGQETIEELQGQLNGLENLPNESSTDSTANLR
jgi:hypothetical protein